MQSGVRKPRTIEQAPDSQNATGEQLKPPSEQCPEGRGLPGKAKFEEHLWDTARDLLASQLLLVCLFKPGSRPSDPSAQFGTSLGLSARHFPLDSGLLQGRIQALSLRM